MLELLLILNVPKTEPALFPQGDETQAPLYAIEGEGFFRLEGDGEIVYTKEFSPDVKNGKLVNETGLPLTPPVHVPPGARVIRISEYGYVYAVINGKPKTLSQLVLAKFPENTSFSQMGSLFKTDARPTLGHPKTEGFGAVIKKEKPADPTSHFAQTDVSNAFVKPLTPLADSSAPANSEPKPPAPLSPTHIKVKPLSVVRGKEVRLGAIAEITGPLTDKLSEISLGPTPALGTSRLITEVTLQSALRSAKLSDLPISWEVPPKAVVRRATRTLTGQEMEGFAREWLKENSYEPSQWRLSSPIPDRVIPDEEFTLNIERKQETQTSLILTLQIKNSEGILFTKQIAFLKAPLKEPTIKVGDRVRVLVKSGLVVVEAQGVVKSLSKEGDVTVVLDETGAILIGKLQADGSVEVKL
ncbi:MAG: hypothetical protein K6T17_02205 [Fimbriimonadales bacterium]|nr:hypothetical protein [Fimbriimonadales bacterium]